ncbi:hypothetical protein PL321_00220 [Caloramator sp. mosi_1]|uniref:hypothetical protein n=1 Tax=Caloramator sp. mosi_1 TaxID=3023090 RepID=UPI0023611559|nr:hypothetical protein [Caloramator sp. mosi_1]WDC84318.1 hypothetical protein PL321_00220 [Caloramator sp. mosi_1]
MFLYFINYRSDEEEICKLEMRAIFNKNLSQKYFFSEKNFDIDRSVFIKYKIDILASSNSFEELVKRLKNLIFRRKNIKLSILMLMKR